MERQLQRNGANAKRGVLHRPQGGAETETLLSLKWCRRLTLQTQKRRAVLHAKPLPVEIRGKECGYEENADAGFTTTLVTQLLKTAATSYTYNSGETSLTAGMSYLMASSLISSNGWFTAAMQRDGNLSYTQSLSQLLTTTTTLQRKCIVNVLGQYYLEMQTDGNLVIYDM